MSYWMKEVFRQFMRNERWGTCGSCPRDSQNWAFPEFCENTERYDHLLTFEQLVDSYQIRKNFDV